MEPLNTIFSTPKQKKRTTSKKKTTSARTKALQAIPKVSNVVARKPKTVTRPLRAHMPANIMPMPSRGVPITPAPPANIPVEATAYVPTRPWYRFACSPRVSFFIGMTVGVIIMGILTVTAWNVVNAEFLWEAVQPPTVTTSQ